MLSSFIGTIKFNFHLTYFVANFVALQIYSETISGRVTLSVYIFDEKDHKPNFGKIILKINNVYSLPSHFLQLVCKKKYPIL